MADPAAAAAAADVMSTPPPRARARVHAGSASKMASSPVYTTPGFAPKDGEEEEVVPATPDEDIGSPLAPVPTAATRVQRAPRFGLVVLFPPPFLTRQEKKPSVPIFLTQV